MGKLRAFKQRSEAQRRRREEAEADAAAHETQQRQQRQQRSTGTKNRKRSAVSAAEAAAAAAHRVAQRRAAEAAAAAAAEAEAAAAAAAANQANARQLAAARLKESRDRMAELVAREEAEKAAARSTLFARRDARLAKWKQQRRQRAHLRRGGRHAAAPGTTDGWEHTRDDDSDASSATMDSVDVAMVAQRAAARALASERDMSPGKQQAAARDAAHSAVRHAQREAQWAAYTATDAFNISVASVRDVYATDTDASDEEAAAAAGTAAPRARPPAPPTHARQEQKPQQPRRGAAAQGSALQRLRGKHSPHKGGAAAPEGTAPLSSEPRGAAPPVAQWASASNHTGQGAVQALPPGSDLQHLLSLQLGSAPTHPISRSVPEQLRTSILAATIVEGSSLEESHTSTAHSRGSSRSAHHTTRTSVHTASSGVGGPRHPDTPQRTAASPQARGTPFTPFTPLEGAMDTFLEAEMRAGIGSAEQCVSPPSGGSLQYSPPSPDAGTPPLAKPHTHAHRSSTPSALDDSGASGVDALNLSIRSLQKLPRAPSAPRLPESRSSTPQPARAGMGAAPRDNYFELQRELRFEAASLAVDDSVDLLNISLPATSTMQPPPQTSQNHAPNQYGSADEPRRTLGALSANTAHGAVGGSKARRGGAVGGAGLLADDSFTAMLQSM